MESTKLDEDSIFNIARMIASSEARRVYLDQACGAHEDLRARVELLLQTYDEEPNFLEVPATDIRAIRDSSVSEGPGAQVGPYKLLEQIGEGGFGVVFMAEQVQPIHRRVALKIIKPGMDTRQVVARFESERQTLALMSHPNIAAIIDGGQTDSGRPYFVMELVRGVPITEFCDTTHMDTEQRLKLFVSVCHAIQHAHHKGIIHRDITPSNVMVTLNDGTPVVKVIDFGVAKAIAQRLTDKTLYTAYGQIIGTPAYMSPEQASTSLLDIDTRSDIYSLGVLLYELLTGTTPIESSRLREVGYTEIQRMIRDEDPPRPSTRLSGLGDSATVVARNRATDPKQLCRVVVGDLDWIVMRALEKDRNRRYASPGNFAEDIERFLNREPIVARPPSAAYRLMKFAERHRAAVLAAASVIAALLVGTTIATWQAVVATQAKHDALTAAAAETEAKQVAMAKEAETQAVLSFVEQRIFAAARPLGQASGLGKDVTLRDTLMQALPQMDASFKQQPLVEARLRLTVGNSFLFLGEAQMAVDQLVRAHTAYSQLLGPSEARTLESGTALANGYRALGRLPEARELSEQTLKIENAKLVPDDPLTLDTMSTLATVYADLDRNRDALELRERVLARRRAQLGPRHVATIKSMVHLSNSLAALNRIDEALKLDQEALVVAEEELGSDHPEALLIRNNLALDYANVHRYDDALKLQQESLAISKAKLGADHPTTLVHMHNVAKALADVDRHAEAVTILENVLALQKIKPGPEHPATLQTMYSLGNRFGKLGRYADALKWHQAALTLREAKLGPDSHDTLYSMWGVATNLLKLGRGKEAVPIIDEVLARAARQTNGAVYWKLANDRLDYFEEAKDAEGCRKTADLWEKLQLKDPISLFAAARFRAVSAAVLRATDESTDGRNRARAEAELAMARLRKAVAAGFHDLAAVKTSKDLNILTDRADFKELLTDLSKSQAKGKQ
jgi:serine/threonine protein kinase